MWTLTIFWRSNTDLGKKSRFAGNYHWLLLTKSSLSCFVSYNTGQKICESSLQFILQKWKAVWSVKISGNCSSLSNIGVWSPKCGRFSRFSLWFTDSQPNNGAFFQCLYVRNTLSVEKGTFIFVFKKKKTWVIWVSPPPNRSRNLVLFTMCLQTIESRNLVPFLETFFLLSVGSTVASHPRVTP